MRSSQYRSSAVRPIVRTSRGCAGSSSDSGVGSACSRARPRGPGRTAVTESSWGAVTANTIRCDRIRFPAPEVPRKLGAHRKYFVSPDPVKELNGFADADRKLVDLARGIRILTPLSWPADVQESFLAAWRRGERRMPEVRYGHESQLERIAALEALAQSLDVEHPIGRWLADTARSYVTVCWLLEHAGTPQMTDFSIALYGRPGDSLAGGSV